MLTERGRVIAVESDGLWVETYQASTCGKCQARHGCGQRMLSGLGIKSNMTVIKAFFTESSSQTDWAPGDQVILGVGEHALLAGALLAYGFPLVTMILGTLLGAFVPIGAYSEASAALGAFLGLVGGGLCVRFLGAPRMCKSYFQAYVLGHDADHIIARAC